MEHLFIKEINGGIVFNPFRHVSALTLFHTGSVIEDIFTMLNEYKIKLIVNSKVQ